VLGRGSYIENDTTVGALTKIQAEAYITAYSTLEDNVFIAPCVVTTNDNWMGRTEKRFGNITGPTIRRGARVGGGAILCPGVEIGEEAFVGAGAVVTKDVPPRMLVVGNPARVLREVPDEELLENAKPAAQSGPASRHQLGLNRWTFRSTGAVVVGPISSGTQVSPRGRAPSASRRSGPAAALQ
jgi:serine acetyltransferase